MTEYMKGIVSGGGEGMGVVTSEKYNNNHNTDSDVSSSLVISHVKGSKAKMSIVCQTY